MVLNGVCALLSARVCVILEPWPKRGSFVGHQRSAQLQKLYSMQIQCVCIILDLHNAFVLVSYILRLFMLANSSIRETVGSQREIKSQEMAKMMELGDYTH